MEKYTDIRELSEAAYRFLMEFDPENCEDGRYELGDGVYANLNTYETKLRKDCMYEAHKNYIDIQFMVHGSEIIAVEPVEEMHNHECLMEYSGEKDLELYANNENGIDHVIRDGEYLILPPKDAHMPGVCVGKPDKARKLVIKVPA